MEILSILFSIFKVILIIVLYFTIVGILPLVLYSETQRISAPLFFIVYTVFQSSFFSALSEPKTQEYYIALALIILFLPYIIIQNKIAFKEKDVKTITLISIIIHIAGILVSRPINLFLENAATNIR